MLIKDTANNYRLTQKITPQTPLFFLASCPLNCEDLLARELAALGVQDIVKLPAAVEFSADIQMLYTCCMWLRIASSIKLVIKKFTADNREALYQQVLTNPWFDHMSAGNTFACQATVSKQAFAPANFLTLLVKDAVADSFRKASASRPNVNTENPDLVVALHMNGIQATLSLELGRSLQERSWRSTIPRTLHGTVLKKHTLSLQENLASALLYRAGWPKAAQAGKIFLDPLCSNGVFVLEACAIASDRAPQLGKTKIGFERWKQFDKEMWQQVQDLAQQRFAQGLQSCPQLHAWSTKDEDITRLQKYCNKAGFTEKVISQQTSFFTTQAPKGPGLILTNPPHGQAFKEPQKIRKLYQDLGQYLKKNFTGWDIALVLLSEELLRELDVRTEKVNSFFSGAEKCYLARFSLYERTQETLTLSQEGQALKKHLEKQYAKFKTLAQDQWHTNVYRLYNNEMQGYLALCDIYEDTLVIQPFDSTPQIKELARICQEITGITRPNTLIKKRRQGSSGNDQYLAQKQTLPVEKIIFEQNYRYFVNLSSYIDTGFYLDHRPLRRWLSKECRGKNVLNLFCYTGSISVVAAGSGATRVCSVDSSKTYISTAQKNAELNKLNSKNMEWLRKDVWDFLHTNEEKWDIIYIDPPTYSNGTGRNNFDIQRDHGRLLSRCLRLLSQGGKLYFSTHFKKFKLDKELECQCRVEDISQKSLDEDCRGVQMVHYLWQIQNKR